MFKDAKKGDKVYDYLIQNWGVVEENNPENVYPIKVRFTDFTIDTYRYDGRINFDFSPTLFWNEVKPIVPPEKPKPPLQKDTPLVVWNREDNKCNRYFSHFNKEGKVECFLNGADSWSSKGKTNSWEHWVLKEENNE